MVRSSKMKGLASLIFGGLYALLLANVSANDNFRCPQLLKNIPDVCKSITCGNTVSKHGCPPNTIYVDNFALCECCPSCVKFLHLNDEDCVLPDSPEVVWTPDPNCDEKEGYCPVKVNTCLPGLECISANANSKKKCVLSERIPNPATEECMLRKSLRQLNLIHWDPDCEADGSFSPKQCKGSLYDGECFCVDREGNRIFGREWQIKAENQTCACSRLVHELRNRQGLTATFHCAPDGNFEPLQCDTDSGLCYCVDPKTGALDGAALPESQWKSLPCFSLNLTDHQEDGKYLRKCESEFAGLRQLQIIGNEHGLKMQPKIINCDFDGSYAPVQIINTQSQCVFKNGTRIKDYFMPRNALMTCNCARDKEEYLPSQDTAFSFSCEQRTGNYEIVYDFGSYSSCVDKDGFLYGDVAPSKYFCCLMNDGCSDSIGKDCYLHRGNVNEAGYKHCEYWRYRN